MGQTPGGEHCVQHVVARAVGAELHDQTFDDEFEHATDSRGVYGGGAEQLTQMHPQAVLPDDANHAQGGAAQGIRVAGAGRLLPDREEAGELVKLVGQGDGDGNRGRRRGLGWTARRVVVADRIGDFGGLRRRAGRSNGP